MKRLVAAAAAVLAVAIAPSPVAAADPVVFVTVDAVELEVYIVGITGMLKDAAAPVTVEINFGSSTEAVAVAAACERKALLAMARPGMYRLEFSWTGWGTPLCKLVRAAPSTP